jgi:hypothetical protein
MLPMISVDLLHCLNPPIIVTAQPQRCNQGCPWKPLLEAVKNSKLKFREEEIIVLAPDEYRPISIGLPQIQK